MPDYESSQTAIVAAVCNGRQAGGGQILAPHALIDDGLLDVIIISHFTLSDISTVLEEIKAPSPRGRFIKYFKTPWIEGESEEYIPVNLDGEPYHSHKIHFKIIPSAIDLILPDNCPLINRKE